MRLIFIAFTISLFGSGSAFADGHTAKFPNGSCAGPEGEVSGSAVTGCGYAGDSGFYVKPDANMFGANLSGVDLSGAKLKDVNFWDANLSGAGLSGAELVAGNFYNANLTGVDFSGADLSKANLWGANLEGATLTGANLSGAFGNDNTICPNGKGWGQEGSDCGF